MAGKTLLLGFGTYQPQPDCKGQSSAEELVFKYVQNAATRQFTTFASMFLSPEQAVFGGTSGGINNSQHDYVSNMNDWQHSLGFLWGQDHAEHWKHH